MHTLSTAACLASALLLAVPRSLAPQDGPDTRPSVHRTAKTTSDKLTAEMQGAWRLTDFKSAVVRQEGRVSTGYALVNGNYIAIEVHVGWTDQDRQVQDRNFLAGMHRFDFDEASHMLMTSMISSSINLQGQLEFEPPGKARPYDVTYAGNRLTLARTDGQLFEFERLPDIATTHRDIFGRPIQEKKEEKKDDAKGEKKDGDKKDG